MVAKAQHGADLADGAALGRQQLLRLRQHLLIDVLTDGGAGFCQKGGAKLAFGYEQMAADLADGEIDAQMGLNVGNGSFHKGRVVLQVDGRYLAFLQAGAYEPQKDLPHGHHREQIGGFVECQQCVKVFPVVGDTADPVYIGKQVLVFLGGDAKHEVKLFQKSAAVGMTEAGGDQIGIARL